MKRRASVVFVVGLLVGGTVIVRTSRISKQIKLINCQINSAGGCPSTTTKLPKAANDPIRMEPGAIDINDAQAVTSVVELLENETLHENQSTTTEEKKNATTMPSSPARQNPPEVCFVSCQFADDIKKTDRPGKMAKEMKEINKRRQRNFIFTNLSQLNHTGWKTIVQTDIDLPYSRVVTKSRWAKFLAYKHPELGFCDVVFYGDLNSFNPTNYSEWVRSGKRIRSSVSGIAQRKQKGNIMNELDSIVFRRKDTRIQTNITLQWLIEQPEFDIHTSPTTYNNGLMGYDTHNSRYRHHAESFWEEYSKEIGTYRDQPLWAFFLHRNKIEPIRLGKLPKGPDGRKGFGGHYYVPKNAA